MSTPQHPLPAGRRRSRPVPPGATLWTAFFDPGSDRNAIERLALAYAVHSEGAGFRRAHLLAWNPDSQALEGRLCWSPPSEERPLEETLTAARWLASDGSDTDATRLLRALRFDLEDLERPIAQAWKRGRAAVLGPEVGPQPWSGAAELGAIPLRHGPRPHGMIVGEWDRRGQGQAERPAITAAQKGGKPVQVIEGKLDLAGLEKIIGHKYDQTGPVAKFTIGRDDLKIREMGATINARMGLNTWAAFVGTDENAAIAGDVAMLESEVNPVLKALRQHQLEVVAIHHHMFGTQPQIIFLHYWGIGNAEQLAKGFKAALNETGKKPSKMKMH